MPKYLQQHIVEKPCAIAFGGAFKLVFKAKPVKEGLEARIIVVPKAFMEFFKVFSDKHLERNSKALYFPKEIRMLILSFLRKPRKFYIQDMGSVHGTYLKLKHQEQKKLLTGQTYQIGGTEVYINIM